MTDRRTQIELMRDILKKLKQPKGITRIMHDAKLSYTQLVKYLKILQDYGFIRKENIMEINHYQITDNGRNFLSLITPNVKKPYTDTP